MAATIIDRGRGPEIAGTRVTVYRIMDFLRESASPQRIADELKLDSDQVSAALKYIHEHREAVEAEYEAILQRLEKQRARAPRSSVTPEELKQRINARRGQEASHAGPSRQ
jgi:uncharacterized protein (DUF433 family)